MAKVQVTKNWTITPNVRLTPFVSLVATMNWFLYQNKVAIVAAGWTLIGTSNGATAAFDGAGGDRWTSEAAVGGIRGTVAAAPQSWALFQNADGVQVLFAYQGAGVSPTGDDIARISMSMSAAYVIAATTTHQPTATDEVICSVGNSLINATASGDRVMSIGCTTENWWCAAFRASVLINFLSVEKFDAAVATVVLAKPYVVSRLPDARFSFQIAGLSQGSPVGTAMTAAGWTGVGTRVFTDGAFRLLRACGSYLVGAAPAANLAVTTYLNSMTPALQQNASVALLPPIWWGEHSTSCFGFLGTGIDWWVAPGTGFNGVSTSGVQGDMVSGLAPGDTQASALRSNWLVLIGAGVVRPWLNAAATLQTT